MTKIQIWFMTLRPKTLFASIGPVLIGLSLAYHDLGNLNFLSALITLLCAMTLQISSNLCNDYFDHRHKIDNQDRLGPLRGIQKGLLSIEELKNGLLISFVISFLLGSYLMITGGLPIVIIGFLSLLFAFIYTGGPFPLSYFALGEITALIFFGPVAVWGTYYLQTHTISYWPILSGFGIGSLASVIMSVNNLRDRESDMKANKTTLAVLLGPSLARKVPLFFLILSFIPPMILGFHRDRFFFLLLFLLPLMLVKEIKRILNDKIDEKLNQTLAQCGKFLFIYSLAFSVIFL